MSKDAVGQMYDQHVAPDIQESREYQKYSVEYAQIAVRSGYILNGGALVAIPAYGGLFADSIESSDLFWSAAAYVSGLVLIILCTIACHANFYNASNLYRAHAAKKHNDFLYRHSKAEGLDPAQNNSLEVDELDRLIGISSNRIGNTFRLAWISGVASYFGFLAGSYLLGQAVLAN